MEQRRFRYLISSLVALVVLQMQAEARQLPRLVVCITVDQLRSDYLRELEPMMGQGGIRLMLERGKVYENVDFPLYQINSASATASIFTGVYPGIHGIEAPTVYLRGKGRMQSPLWDEAYQGSYTRDALSPRAVLANTLGDRLKEASGGTSLVYSVAPDAEVAIVSAGALADGAYWLDSQIGAWSSTSYYPPMPAPLEHYNRSSEGPNKRLVSGNVVWKPLRTYSDPVVTFSARSKSFSYRYQAKDILRYKHSALVNEEVTALALRLLEHAGYAERKSPGLLAISYTAAPQTSEELSAEDVDTYIRLDAEVAKLLQGLDKEIGLKNCLVGLSGTGYTSYHRSVSSGKALRSISTERLKALTNMFLTATYGPGDWVEHNRLGRLYLNRQLLENKKLSLERIQQEVADFLRKADGLAEVTPQYAIRNGSATPDLQHVSRSVHHRYEADVYWSLLSGWSIEEELDSSLWRSVSTVPSPFILMGGDILPQTFNYPVRDVRDIVRVICSILRIRPPNSIY